MVKERPGFNRHNWNITMFIISYILINLLRGIVFDSYINYLQEVAPLVAKSFSSYQGIAGFISAFMILLANKIGYKWTILICPISAVISLVSILLFHNIYIYQFMTILLLVSVQLFIAILPPFLTTYTSLENRTVWYSRAFWLGYFGWSLTTYLGGFATVLRFASRTGKSFSQAKDLTRHLDSLGRTFEIQYIKANKDILLISSFIAALAVLPILFIRQEKEDYYVEKSPRDKSLISSLKNGALGRDAYVFLLYISLVTFSMGLFSPYFTVFLNRGLHIDRSTSSLMVSISYMATVLFIMAGPRIIYRLGHITTLGLSVFLSMPFMLIIANGDKFGKYTVPVVGLALFLRSGFANLGEPVESALPMETVAKEYRTLMSSLVNILNGLMNILAGYFTGNFLFKDNSGYRLGYYISFCIYLFTTSLMMVYFRKNYDNMASGKIKKEA